MNSTGTLKTVFVTGASRGIGLQVSRALLKEGYDIVAVARKETEEYAELRSAYGHSADFLPADLGRKEDLDFVARSIRSCRSMYGLVNNAGVAPSGLHVSLPGADMEDTVSVNLMAPMVLSQAAVKAMSRSRAGRIVTISSICAQRPYRGLGVYTATKAALEGFTRVLAAEVGAWGITANCVAPGFIGTAMNADLSETTQNRIQRRAMLPENTTAEDIASAVSFLLSPAASAVTAEVLRVDAGAAA